MVAMRAWNMFVNVTCCTQLDISLPLVSGFGLALCSSSNLQTYPRFGSHHATEQNSQWQLGAGGRRQKVSMQLQQR